MKYLIMAMMAMNALNANAAKVYFSSQVDDRKADFNVRIGNQDCTFRNTQFTNVNITAPWIEQGITEKVALCEFDLAPGTYEYEVKVVTAPNRTYGYVYYWALNSKPIDNWEVMYSMEELSKTINKLKMLAADSYIRIKKNKPLEVKGTITIH